MATLEIPPPVLPLIDPYSGTPYWLPILINGANIAAGGSAQGVGQNETGWVFRVEYLMGDAYNAAEVASAIEALTDLPLETPGTFGTAGTGVPTLNSLRLKLEIGDTSLMGTPIPFGMVCGTGREPYVLNSPFWIKDNQEVRATAYNDNAADYTLRARVVFGGTRYRRR